MVVLVVIFKWNFNVVNVAVVVTAVEEVKIVVTVMVVIGKI
jgi:hypothetical protein